MWKLAYLLTLAFVACEAIKWKNCDYERSPARITEFYMSPDPVVLRPGHKVSFGGRFKVVGETGNEFKLHLKMEKKILWFWTKIPCRGKVGSCTYSGISCDKIKDWVGGNRCPLPYKEYKLGTQSISLGNINVPDFVKSGSYRLTLDLRDANTDRRIACVQATAKAKA